MLRVTVGNSKTNTSSARITVCGRRTSSADGILKGQPGAAQRAARLDRMHGAMAGLVVCGEQETAAPVCCQETRSTGERHMLARGRQLARHAVDGEAAEREFWPWQPVHATAAAGPWTAMPDIEGAAGV